MRNKPKRHDLPTIKEQCEMIWGRPGVIHPVYKTGWHFASNNQIKSFQGSMARKRNRL